MIRTYGVKYKSKSKMLTTQEAVENTEKAILENPLVKSVKIEEQGQVVSVEADEKDFTEVMNDVVNVFRKLDDKSEVSYKFGLNRN